MAENKLKHLEFAQGVVNRLAGNSFMIKGWAVTLAAALLALGSLDANQSFLYLAYLPVAVFWGLDGYFLWQERLFRRLYDYVAQKNEEDIDFSLNTTAFQSEESWSGAFLSVTLVSFYSTVLGAIAIVGFLS